MQRKQERINRAIRECVAYCSASSNIVASLAKFVRELRTSGDWGETDISVIESNARHLFASIVDDGTYAGDATNTPASSIEPGPKPPKVNGI